MPPKKKQEETSNLSPLQALKAIHARIDQTQNQSNARVSTGSLFLDLMISPKNPGIPCGKTLGLVAEFGAGKTSFMLSMARAALNENKRIKNPDLHNLVFYYDIENGIGPEQLQLYGLTMYDTENFLFTTGTNYGPDILNSVEEVLIAMQGKPNKVLICLDGLGHLRYTKDNEKTDFESTTRIAINAVKLKDFFINNKARMAKTNVCLCYSTFYTANIKMNKNPSDPDVIISGGAYLKYATDIGITLKNAGAKRELEFKPPSSPYGVFKNKPLEAGNFQDIKMGFWKNKCSVGKEVTYTLCMLNDEEQDYRPGIMDLKLMVEYALKKSLMGLRAGGHHFYLDGVTLNGKSEFKKALMESLSAAKENREPSNPAFKGLFERLYKEVREEILKEYKMDKDAKRYRDEIAPAQAMSEESEESEAVANE